MPHPAMTAGNVALITGGASGIGLAAAMWLARRGLKICIADLGSDHLSHAAALLAKRLHPMVPQESWHMRPMSAGPKMFESCTTQS